MNWIRPVSGLCLLLVCLVSSPALGVWSHDPAENNLVSDMPGLRYSLKAVSDGGGGVVLVWEDQRAYPNLDIYAQRVDASGNRLWPAEGLPICTLSTYQGSPSMDSDGQGGFVIVWDDDRDMDGRREIFAQRITGGGIPFWMPDGVALSTSEDYNQVPFAVGDGSGGVYAVWSEENNKVARGGEAGFATPGEGITFVGNAIHAQHASDTGDTLWGPGGMVVSGPGVLEHAVAADGEGGLLVAWIEGGTPRVQRFIPAGEPRWVSGGVIVVEAVAPAAWIIVMSDGLGGAIVVLQIGYGDDANIYAQWSYPTSTDT
jgi:hypothetical protein